MMHHHEKQVGEAATVLNPNARNSVFLICDHASNNIPAEFDNLGVETAVRQDHVAWDIGTGHCLVGADRRTAGTRGSLVRDD